jgi:hypothetical protein
VGLKVQLDEDDCYVDRNGNLRLTDAGKLRFGVLPMDPFEGTVVVNSPSDDPTEEMDAEVIAKYGYPPALAKACRDWFSYALRLRSGPVICFSSAEPISPDWVHLDGLRTDFDEEDRLHRRDLCDAHAPPCPRGLDVRVAEIAWVADDPWGGGT